VQDPAGEWNMFFPSTKINAAINALLAEHLLSYVELAPQNPYAKTLADAMLAAAKSRAPKKFDAAQFAEEFNTAPRFTQLNVIASGSRNWAGPRRGRPGDGFASHSRHWRTPRRSRRRSTCCFSTTASTCGSGAAPSN
jgi:hypothetical protein